MSRLRYNAFKNEDANLCNKLVDYYKGNQEPYVVAMLDGKMKGYGVRKNWKIRGVVPTFSNKVKEIVDKSATLFNKVPTFEIWPEGSTSPITDPVFQEIWDSADGPEFYQNVASYVRLLKSVCVYTPRYVADSTMTTNGIYQFSSKRGDALLPTLLHHGNCEVIMDTPRRSIIELAMLTDMDCDDEDDNDDGESVKIYGKYKELKKDFETYKVITPTTIEYWAYIVDEEVDELALSITNPDGFVPAYMQHDTSIPLNGKYWNCPPSDIARFQEIYNMSLTDTMWAVAHQKQKSLFLTGDILDSESAHDVLIPSAQSGYTEAGAVYDDIASAFSTKSNIGGLGEVVRLTVDDKGNTPLVKYDGPQSDLNVLDKVLNDYAVDIARQWCVNMKEGSGTASSGFALVVEEIDGLTLRETQAQYFQAGFRRLYENLRVLYPELPDGNLIPKFAPPSLPVNEGEVINNNSKLIVGGRMSVVDDIMQREGLNRDEAMKRALQIKADNELFMVQKAPPAKSTSGTTVIEAVAQGN